MLSSVRNTNPQDHEALYALLDTPLRAIVRHAKRVWFNRDRLDRVLAEYVSECPHCELIYALDPGGRQISSNIYTGSIDADAYGQDLSRRPYSVTLSVLHNAAFQGVFLCAPYVSQATRHTCVTVMHGVTSGRTTLGFVAADLELSLLWSDG